MSKVVIVYEDHTLQFEGTQAEKVERVLFDSEARGVEGVFVYN